MIHKTLQQAKISMLCLLSGCVGVSVGDIRNSSVVHEEVSAKSMDDVLFCLNTALDQFRGDGRMLTASYPQKPLIEISIGALQMGNFKHHYMIELRNINSETRILFKSAGKKFMPMSESKLIKYISECT